MYKRMVIKLSGEALSGETEIYDNSTIDRILSDIINLSKKGTEIALAVGGGNIWRGRMAEDMDSTKADQMGMLATVINSLYLADRLRAKGQKTLVLTPFVVGNFTVFYSKEAALEGFEQNKVLIFGGGIGHPFFSTDTLPALRAAELNCDCVLFAKNVDGVYNKNPDHPDAVRYKKITYAKILQDGLEALDQAAMVICQKNKIPSVVFSLKHTGILLAAEGNVEDFGTIIEE